MRILNFKIFSIIRRFVYISLGGVDELLGRKNKIVVLCYHGISNNNWFYNTKLEEFDKQMEYMISKYNPIQLKDLYLYLSGKIDIDRPSFVITFDDGYKNILKSNTVLSKYNIKPSVFLITDRKNINKGCLGTNNRLLNDKDITLLKNKGWELGSHGMTHSYLDSVCSSVLTAEVVNSKKILKKKNRNNIEYFAYPKGSYSKNVINEVKKAGYKLGLSMDDDIITEETNPFVVPRIGVNLSHTLEEFKYLASPSVIMCRGFIKNYLFKYFV